MKKANNEKRTNMTTPLTVKVLTASGCSRCLRAKALAKGVVA